jgi:membrane-bound metal-dependent hydrolase YbcI (DUF457 family)
VLPAWGILLALLCALVWRTGPRWRAYFGVIAWGIGIHIAGDVITSFGTMIFAPFTDARYALSTTFIIDPWFTSIVLAGLLAALVAQLACARPGRFRSADWLRGVSICAATTCGGVWRDLCQGGRLYATECHGGAASRLAVQLDGDRQRR